MCLGISVSLSKDMQMYWGVSVSLSEDVVVSLSGRDARLPMAPVAAHRVHTRRLRVSEWIRPSSG